MVEPAEQRREIGLLKVGGIFVSPLEIENCLLSHPAVREAAVIGWADEQGLIKPKAFVVVRKGNEPSTELAAQLQQYVKDTLAPYKYPRVVEFIDSLPKSSNDKVNKKALEEMESANVDAAL